MPETFLFHDYETFGLSPGRDRPAQFGARRTNADFQPVGEPVVHYCQPPRDTLPHPGACLVTGITPQECAKRGLKEAEFAAEIRDLMMQPNTCSVGYNSMRFDDEVTRNLLYRNLHDPYQREYGNGRSRFDLIDLVRACYALRPEGIEWPLREDGAPSFRLEHLTRANNIEHGAAHDALADVDATIAMAQLLRSKQPRLLHYALGLRQRERVEQLVLPATDPARSLPFLHTSSRIHALRGCTSLFLAIAPHPVQQRKVICMDLAPDPRPWLDATAEQISEALYTRTEDLPDGMERPGVKLIATNKVPFVAPAALLKDMDRERIGLDADACLAHAELLRQHAGFRQTLASLYADENFSQPQDVDLQIYSGFFSGREKAQMAQAHQLKPADLSRLASDCQDARLRELMFRFQARNWPESLNSAQQQRWQQLRYDRLFRALPEVSLGLQDYEKALEEQLARQDLSKRDRQVLTALAAWPMELHLDALRREVEVGTGS